jgi:hypothetical protein
MARRPVRSKGLIGVYLRTSAVPYFLGRPGE